MAKGQNQKLKLLYLLKILEEETDEKHSLSVQDLTLALGRHGITAERKTIYDDIEALQAFGYDIVVDKGRCNRYYMGARTFEPPELKLLVDAAQSAKFITEKKSRQLIQKISALASRHEAQMLQRQVYVHGRVKAMDEGIYYTVDKLQDAMAAGHMVRCHYYEWAVDAKSPRLFSKRYKRGGQFYEISPWALVWDDENYYLLAYDHGARLIKHYRVDKLSGIEPLDRQRQGRTAFEELDLAVYTKRRFGMFGGEETDVTLRFSNRMVGVAVDRFGKDIFLRRDGEDYFTTTVRAVISPQFIGWVLGLGGEAQVLAPQQVVDAVKRTLDSVRILYA